MSRLTALALALAVVGLFAMSAVLPADDKPKVGKGGDAAVVPMYRFLNKQNGEHLYTNNETEVEGWKKSDHMVDEGIIGYALNTKSGPDTARLYRAINRKTGKHFFYLTKPTTLKDTGIEDIVMYVWTKPGEGRVAIHACVLTDNTDTYMDQDLKRIEDTVTETKKGTGMKRRLMKNYFYLQAKEN